MPTPIIITVELTDAQAESFAKFLRQVEIHTYYAVAAGPDEAEAHTMRAGGEAINRALVALGYTRR
jgi:hypothetical protein